MTKRLVFCFDGTWNRLSAEVPTNVAKIAQMVRPVAADGLVQIVHYEEGIGTNTWKGRRMWEGATGKGLMDKLRSAYRFLIFNYEPGDQIFAFGFSRGAYTARSFLGFIRHAGILDVISANQIDKAIELYRRAPAGVTGEESGQAMRFRLKFCRGVCVSETDREFRWRTDPDSKGREIPLLDLRFLGVWDTVSALGVPQFVPASKWLNRKYGFHNAVLTSKITAARHAIAIDELRPTFRHVPFGRDKVVELNQRAETLRGRPCEEWELPYMEKWFPGVHGAVGGGGARRGLSDNALDWVLTGARRAGLDVRGDDDAQTFMLSPNSFDNLENTASTSRLARVTGKLRGLAHSPRTGPTHADEIALSTYQRWFAPGGALPDGKPYRPGALAPMARQMDGWPYAGMQEYKSEHVLVRGDTLSRLARDWFADPMRYREIFDANRDRIDDPEYIPVGLSLRRPN